MLHNTDRVFSLIRSGTPWIRKPHSRDLRSPFSMRCWSTSTLSRDASSLAVKVLTITRRSRFSLRMSAIAHNFKLQLQLQKVIFDTNIHEHSNNIHVIMLCLETFIKVYTYRLHKSPQGRSGGIRVILNTIAYKTAFCMKWRHSFSQWAAVYKWTNEIFFFLIWWL